MKPASVTFVTMPLENESVACSTMLLTTGGRKDQQASRPKKKGERTWSADDASEVEYSSVEDRVDAVLSERQAGLVLVNLEERVDGQTLRRSAMN